VLAQQGGRLISVESDPAWAAVVGRLVEQAGVAEAVRPIHAPLEGSPHSLDAGPWYATGPVVGALAGRAIDALLVDGPPAHAPRTRLARYPAVPVLREFLAERCAIFLDDVSRPGEREIGGRWSKLLGLRFDCHYARCGMAVAQRGPAFFIYL
jgi:hypothetical protein